MRVVILAVCTDLLHNFPLTKDHRGSGHAKRASYHLLSRWPLYIHQLAMALVKMLCRCGQGLEVTPHGSNSAESDVSLVQIFPKMKNYTPYNRATSVGNQLLNNYRKFLLNYEICHRSRDLGGPLATPSAVTEVRDAISQRILLQSSSTAYGKEPRWRCCFQLLCRGKLLRCLGCSATASSEHLYDYPSSPPVHLLGHCCRQLSD